MQPGIRGVMRWSLLVGCIGTAFFGSPPAAAGEDLPRRPNAAPETYSKSDVIYDSVRDIRQQRVRVIVTRPRAGHGNFPAIFVAGWLSCDSIEAPASTDDASGKVFRMLAELPGFVTVRVDKPGVGDSEGVCKETDFNTELSAYRAAFRSLSRYPFIDRNNVFVLGISNGGGFAPLVAEDAPVRGYVIDGGWVKSWFEHMMEIERRRFELSGNTPGEVNQRVRSTARLYEYFLIEGQRPADLLARHPELRPTWAGDDDDHLYGRPIAFYQQLQQLNLEGAWARVRVPTLVLHGQYDWIMSRDDHERIAALVNRNLPGAAQFIELPATGHTFEHYANQQAAFEFKASPFDPGPGRIIGDWLQRHR
jgi:pimeloyl-ACP methyl ester carboxylesterase